MIRRPTFLLRDVLGIGGRATRMFAMNAKRIGVMALCLCVVPVAVAGGRETEVAAGWGDFSFDLCESVAPPNYLGVGSGWSVAAPLPAPIEWTVLGVGKFFAPPVACADFKLLLPLQANGYDISDDPTLYGGAGLLYSGSTWKPDRIVCAGDIPLLQGRETAVVRREERVGAAIRAGRVPVESDVSQPHERTAGRDAPSAGATRLAGHGAAEELELCHSVRRTGGETGAGGGRVVE